jgi:hypothetical protein
MKVVLLIALCAPIVAVYVCAMVAAWRDDVTLADFHPDAKR